MDYIYTLCYLPIFSENLKLFYIKFKIHFIYLFLQRGEGEREGEKHQCARETLVASHAPPIGHPACSPGMLPERIRAWRLVAFRDHDRPTEPDESGQFYIKLKHFKVL